MFPKISEDYIHCLCQPPPPPPPPYPTKEVGGHIVFGMDPIGVGVGVKLLVLSVT